MSSQPQAQLHEFDKVLHPDLHQEHFFFGKNKDGSPRKWKMEALGWKHEKNFRVHAMKLLGASYAPFETAIAIMSQKFYSDMTPSLVASIAASETQVDAFLEASVHAILLSQDKDITMEWVQDNAESREQMLQIVYRQCEIHKLIDRLGESLAERLEKLISMMGLKIDFSSLKQLLKQLSDSFSAKISKLDSTVHNAIGPYMESTKETMSHQKSEQEMTEQKPIVKL